jgi:IclR family transcriptional regulator, pca regulon regulatory protein
VTRERPAATPVVSRGPDFVQSLERGLAVIRAFDAANPALTLSDVARSTGLTRAAARRFLHTLAELGYVRSDGRLFSLRPRVLDLGYSYLSSLSLPEVAMPHMEHLVEQVRESCSLSVLDGEDVVYVARVPTKRIMTVAINVGTRFPAYATSMGRVLLAHAESAWLDEYLATVQMVALTRTTVTSPARLREKLVKVRAQGFCLVDQELEEGLRSIAVPVHESAGGVVAAMNVSATIRRGSAESIRKELLPPLLEAARAVAADADLL